MFNEFVIAPQEVKKQMITFYVIVVVFLSSAYFSYTTTYNLNIIE